MTIRSTHPQSGVLATGLVACTLLLTTTGQSHAAPAGGSAKIESAKGIAHTVQGKVYDRGTLFRPPTTIKPPPGPRIRDNRGDATKFVAPTCGHRPRPCKGMPRK